MEKEKAIKIAVKKTIEIVESIGVKLRAREILKNSSDVHVIFDKNKFVESVKVWLYFEDFGERGKVLRKEKNRLLNFFNATVMEDFVFFTFTLKELEVEETSEESDVSKESIENVMKKIEKLLALSASDNEHESISASLKAQKLLKKYNLHIEEITGQEKKEEITECTAFVKPGNKWKYNLADIVAKNYCCKCFYIGSERIVFYGYKSDTVIARRMFVYLFDVGCRLARTYEKQYREEVYYNAKGVYNSFCKGFTDGINEQLSKQCTALMLVVPEEVSEQYKIRSVNFGTIDASINLNDIHAYKEGKEEEKGL